MSASYVNARRTWLLLLIVATATGSEVPVSTHDANTTAEGDESEPSPAVRSPQQPAASSGSGLASFLAANPIRPKDDVLKALRDLQRALTDDMRAWSDRRSVSLVTKAVRYIDGLRQPMLSLASVWCDLASSPAMGPCLRVLAWFQEIVRDGACSDVAHLDAGRHGVGKRQRRS